MDSSFEIDKIRRLVDEVVLAARSDPAAAERLAAEIESIAKQNPSSLVAAYHQRANGHVHQIRGRMPEAVQSYRTAHALFEQCLEHVEQARTASTLVGALVPLGEFDEALRFATQAGEIFQQAGLPLRAARLEVNVGNLYHRLNRLEEALSCYERASEVLENSDDREAAAGLLINRSVILMLLYRFDDALQGFIRARQFSEQHGLQVFTAQSEYNRAYLLFLIGDYAQSIRIMQDAEVRFQEIGDAIHVAHCRIDRAEILLQMNLPEYARGLATLAEDGFRSSGLNGDRARALLLLGRCLAGLGQNENALDQYIRARSLFQSEGNTIGASVVDLETAAVMMTAGKLDEAKELAAQAANVFRTQQHLPLSALADLFNARLCIENRESERAVLLLDRCEQSQEFQLPANLRYRMAYLKGRALELGGRIHEARDSYRTAIDSLEFLLNHISVDHAMLRFLEDKKNAYERLAALTDDAQEAFELADRARTRVLTACWDLDNYSEQGRGRVRSLRESLRSDHLRLFQSDSPHSGSLLQRISENEHRFTQELLEERFGQEQTVQRPEAQTTKTAADEVILEYFINDDSVTVFVVRNGVTERVMLPISTSELHQEVTFARSGLTWPGKSRREPALRYHLERLYDALFSPVAPSLTTRVVVIPHGFLHHLPFHVLSGPDGYMAEQYVISYAASMAAYVRATRKVSPPSCSSLVIGTEAPDLPAAVDEVRDVAGKLPNAAVAIDKSLDEIRSALESATFIHIASHGLFRPENPSWSLLNLGRDVLSPADMMNLHVNADLVTMSACSIGKTIGSGVEVQGFVRALLQQNVPSIIAALWQVDDSATSLLMRSFYSRLQNSPDIAANLRSAMLEVKHHFAHPYYWGGFVLFGRQKLGSSWNSIHQAATQPGCTDSSAVRTLLSRYAV